MLKSAMMEIPQAVMAVLQIAAPSKPIIFVQVVLQTEEIPVLLVHQVLHQTMQKTPAYLYAETVKE